MNYADLYQWGLDELSAVGIEEAVLESRLLLESICGTKRHDLIIHGDVIVEEEKEESFREGIRMRCTHIPLAYIIGSQEFMGLTFQVNPHVLIPRQDTEVLVECVMKNLHDGMSILDMCTGSGCILLSLLYYSNDCQGIGADISAAALEVASKNAESLKLEAQWVESNLFENISGKFDIIVSNPPYIEAEIIATLQEEVWGNEPEIALNGREDGLFFYRKIMNEIDSYLYNGSMLYFEIGHNQAVEVSGLMKEAGFHEITVIKDLAGHDRVVHGIYGGNTSV